MIRLRTGARFTAQVAEGVHSWTPLAGMTATAGHNGEYRGQFSISGNGASFVTQVWLLADDVRAHEHACGQRKEGTRVRSSQETALPMVLGIASLKVCAQDAGDRRFEFFYRALISTGGDLPGMLLWR